MNVECRWGPLRFGLTIIFAALHESAIGTKQTFQTVSFMSAFGGKADMGFDAQNVCF